MWYTIYFQQRSTDPLTGKRHSHTGQIELIQVLSGRGTVILGSEEYTFEKGSVLCFDGAIPHYILPEDQEVYARSKLILSRELLSLVCEVPPTLKLHFHADSDLQTALSKHFTELSGLSGQDCAAQFRAASVIFEMLHLCFRQSARTLPSSNGTVSRILRHINANLEGDLSIDAIARACHMSKYHMCRLFRQKTGTTIGSYIQLQRIYAARCLLEEGSEPISQIALQVGYNDLSHFSKVFRKETGLSPTQYRKSGQG